MKKQIIGLGMLAMLLLPACKKSDVASGQYGGPCQASNAEDCLNSKKPAPQLRRAGNPNEDYFNNSVDPQFKRFGDTPRKQEPWTKYPIRFS